MQRFLELVGRQPALGDDAVQVWRFRTSEEVQSGWDWLSGLERARAERMRAGVAREEFVLGRVALRRLLGGLLGCQAAEVPLTVGANGRPWVQGGVDFNLAHSHGLVLIALVRGGRVGVDVEFRNPAVEAQDIAEANFHQDERAAVAGAADGEQRLLAFYRCWTRKEAVLKADGRGVIDNLNVFSVAPGAVQNSGMGGELQVRLPDGAALWVRDLQVEPGFAAALACDRPGLRVDLLDGESLSGYR